MHYAFVRMGQEYAHGSVDPIELVSDICAVTGDAASADVVGSGMGTSVVKVEVSDIYGRTPLHYAAMLGAQICAKYLIQRGAVLTTTDCQGNQVSQPTCMHTSTYVVCRISVSCVCCVLL